MRHPSRAVPTVGLALMFVLGAASAAAADTPSPTPGAAAASPAAAPGDGHDTKHGTDHQTDHQTKPGAGEVPKPGMDMPATKPATGTGHDSMPGMDMPAPADEHPEPVSRPRGLVLGGFAAVNSAVLLGAVGLRRRSAAK